MSMNRPENNRLQSLFRRWAQSKIRGYLESGLRGFCKDPKYWLKYQPGFYKGFGALDMENQPCL